MSLGPLAHHAEFCLIHFKRLTCKLNAAYNPHGSRSHLGQWLGLWSSCLQAGFQAGTVTMELDLGFLCKPIEADALISYPWCCCCYCFGSVSPSHFHLARYIVSLLVPWLIHRWFLWLHSPFCPLPFPKPPTFPAPRHLVVLLLCQQAAGVSGSQLCCPHVPKAVDVFHSQTCCWMTLVNARLGRKEAGMLR